MYTLNNDELAEAIAYAHDNAVNANNGYSVSNSDRARSMLEHMRKLLEEQLKRAKHESCTHVPRQ